MTQTPFIPLFSGGSGRSGTTIIVNLLSRHNLVHTSMPREIRYLTDSFGLLDLNFGTSRRIHGRRITIRNNAISMGLKLFRNGQADFFLKRLNSTWWSGTGKRGAPRGLVRGISKESLDEIGQQFRSEVKEDKYLASRGLFFSLSNAQVQKSGVKYFADSTPLNAMNADRLYRLFPEAYFIDMLRDGRDAVYSVCQEEWGPNDPLRGLEWWKSRVLRGHLALSQLPPKNVLHMRLEDLVQRDREGSYAQLLNFLNLDHVKKMDTYFNEVMTTEKMSQGVWKSKVSRPKDFDKRYQQILKELADQGLIIAQYY